MSLQQLIEFLGDDAHGDGIFHHHLVGHADEEVCFRTYPLLACAGLDALRHVEVVTVGPACAKVGDGIDGKHILLGSLHDGACFCASHSQLRHNDGAVVDIGIFTFVQFELDAG